MPRRRRRRYGARVAFSPVLPERHPHHEVEGAHRPSRRHRGRDLAEVRVGRIGDRVVVGGTGAAGDPERPAVVVVEPARRHAVVFLHQSIRPVHRAEVRAAAVERHRRGRGETPDANRVSMIGMFENIGRQSRGMLPGQHCHVNWEGVTERGFRLRPEASEGSVHRLQRHRGRLHRFGAARLERQAPYHLAYQRLEPISR
jgi:hypothetical protein